MYPATFFGLFPPFPRDSRVFVAMSFDERFIPRWEQVLAPGIRDIQLDGRSLEPHRVDLSLVSAPILTEILDGISRCRLVVADITSIGSIGNRPQRNGNVMYEVGLAHAVRLPEEVVLLRSDRDQLDFDIAGVRVRTYDPDNSPSEARLFVAEAVQSALRAVDQKAMLSVRRAAESLDGDAWGVLIKARLRDNGEVDHKLRRTVGDSFVSPPRERAIQALLDQLALRTELRDLTYVLAERGDGATDLPAMSYRLAPFGAAVADYGIDRLGLVSAAAADWMDRHSVSSRRPTSADGTNRVGRQ